MTITVHQEDAITCRNQIPAPRGGRKTCGAQVLIAQMFGVCPVCGGMVW